MEKHSSLFSNSEVIDEQVYAAGVAETVLMIAEVILNGLQRTGLLKNDLRNTVTRAGH
jgi:hypothetical protein